MKSNRPKSPTGSEVASVSPFEAAIGMPVSGETPRHLGRPESKDAAEALEAAILPALEAGPCYVAFSGGRDSSVVLAAATSVSRKAGLQLPIALTFRFPGAPETYENEWQAKVIEQLGSPPWHTVELAHELAVIGPVATAALQRFGPYWPANAHFMSHLATRAGGGTLLSGLGGDELFAWWRWQRAAGTLAGHRAPRLGNLGAVALALAPVPVRRRYDGHVSGSLPWLTDRGTAEYRQVVGRFGDCPLRWDRQLAWMRSRAEVSAAIQTTQVMCEAEGVRYETPLLDRRFLASLAAAGGAWGWKDRTAMLREVFGRLLSENILTRTTKARFNAVSFGPHLRAFAQDWDGNGVDATWVVPGVLREMWLTGASDWRTASLLQQAWWSTVKG